MIPKSGMLAVFASKNKQVVQIRIQVSHAEVVPRSQGLPSTNVEAVFTRVEFAIVYH